MMRFAFSSMLAGAAATAIAAAPANAVGQGYDYDIYVGGSQVAEMRVVIERSGAPEATRYRIATTIGLVGMASWVSDWTGRSEVEGQFLGGRPVPDRFISYNRFHERERTVTMSYSNGAVASVVIEEPIPADDDDEGGGPVSAAMQQGTVDPLTGMLAAFLSPADCGGDRRLFDGRRATAVEIKSANQGVAPASGYGVYDGPATICVFEMKHVGGRIRRWEEERRGQSEMSVWLASVADDLAVPVRIEADTEWGALRGHLVGVSTQEAAN